MSIVEDNNPYVGPTAFGKDDWELFFGRDREARRLLSLIVANPLVLFYAPSGAGKSSLLKARLWRDLEDEGCEVLWVPRLGAELPSGAEPANVYVFNALLYLEDQLPADSEPADSGPLERESLAAFLARRRAASEAKDEDWVLIFDQFEEILTTHRERAAEREDFFHQLRRALDADPLLSVVLALREDHLAGLDRYAPLLRDRLRTRFRMEQLDKENAVLAIRKPARKADRSFAEGVAEELADNLRRERRHLGEFVEPVQLQVVCFQLWKSLDHEVTEITAKHLEECDVDRALENFYETTVAEAADGEVTEIQIRRWFEDTLITPAGRRNQVSLEGGQIGGLPKAAVEQLAAQHLIRAEKARSADWYELAHDRMVEPIRQANQRWREKVPLLAGAQAWENNGRDVSFLYQGTRLAAAEAWAEAHGRGLQGPEREFLDESEEEQRRRAEKTKNARVRVWGLAVALLVALALFGVTWRQSRLSEARRLIITALSELETSPQQSLDSALKAADSGRRYSWLTGGELEREFETILRQTLGAMRARKLWSGERKDVSTIALSPGGRQLAMATPEGLEVWDLELAVQVFKVPDRTWVWAMDLSPGGRWLAVVSEDAVEIYDVRSGAAVRQLAVQPSAQIQALAFSPDGAHLATAGEDTTIRIWTASSGQQVSELVGHTGTVYYVAFSLESRRLASASDDGTVRVWNPASGEELSRYDEAADTVAFSPDSQHLASAGAAGTAKVWDLATGKQIAGPFDHRQWVTNASFSPDSNYLTTVSIDGTTHIWNLFSGHSVAKLPSVWELGRTDFSSDGGYLATAGEDGVEVWQLIFEDVPTLVGHRDKVESVAFSPDGRLLASASNDGTVRVWDADTGEQLLPLWQAAARDLAFNPAGRRLAAASGQQVRIWDTSSGNELPSFSGHTKAVYAVSFSPNGRWLASASADGSARLWDPAAGKILRVLEVESAVYDVAFSPDSRRLATAEGDGTARLWDPESGEALLTLKAHDGAVNAVAFSPDARWLVTAGIDGEVKIWNAALPQGSNGGDDPQHTLVAHDSAVSAVAFSPNGRWLASCGLDRTVILWEVETGRERRRLPSGSIVEDLAFSPDGARLAIAGRDGTVRLEPVRLEDLIALAKRAVGQG